MCGVCVSMCVCVMCVRVSEAVGEELQLRTDVGGGTHLSTGTETEGGMPPTGTDTEGGAHLLLRTDLTVGRPTRTDTERGTHLSTGTDTEGGTHLHRN